MGTSLSQLSFEDAEPGGGAAPAPPPVAADRISTILDAFVDGCLLCVCVCVLFTIVDRKQAWATSVSLLDVT